MSITRKDVDAIFAQVRANSALLVACVGPHDFQRIDPLNPLSKYRCTKCGGELRGECVHWYERGLLHAKSSPK